jgi:hypothetical protein
LLNQCVCSQAFQLVHHILTSAKNKYSLLCCTYQLASSH